mmetsp:Transcript_108819/g.318373  ORF Transcript_108819/g.318373 Transcript_108819/m.318373 type:complete len:231 (+) Transcript_108819:4772-5464(+)
MMALISSTFCSTLSFTRLLKIAAVMSQTHIGGFSICSSGSLSSVSTVCAPPNISVPPTAAAAGFAGATMGAEGPGALPAPVAAAVVALTLARAPMASGRTSAVPLLAPPGEGGSTESPLARSGGGGTPSGMLVGGGGGPAGGVPVGGLGAAVVGGLGGGCSGTLPRGAASGMEADTGAGAAGAPCWALDGTETRAGALGSVKPCKVSGFRVVAWRRSSGSALRTAFAYSA